MLNVAAYTGGKDVPSARFRLRQHIPALRDLSIEVREHWAKLGSYPPASKALRPLPDKHQGLTDPLFQALDDALRTHELVKVALAKTTDVTAKDASHAIAERLGADVVQTIGRTCTLYRHNPDLKRKKGDLPPWR